PAAFGTYAVEGAELHAYERIQQRANGHQPRRPAVRPHVPRKRGDLHVRGADRQQRAPPTGPHRPSRTGPADARRPGPTYSVAARNRQRYQCSENRPNHASPRDPPAQEEVSADPRRTNLVYDGVPPAHLKEKASP